MKKYYILIIIVFMCTLFNKNTLELNAISNSYTEYKELYLAKGELISNWTSDELKKYEKKLGRRKIQGYNTYIVNKDVRCTFIARTLLSTYNNGYSPISYSSTLTESETVKTSINVTGTLKTKMSGNIKKFKTSFDQTIKTDVDYSTIKVVKKDEHISLTVDPKTELVIYIKGEGRLTNGYAKEYSMFITVSKGAFEYFVITDIYTHIEMNFIW